VEIDDLDWIETSIRSKITPLQYAVVMMDHLGYESDEIAAALKMKNGAVRALKMRGLLSLRRKFAA